MTPEASNAKRKALEATRQAWRQAVPFEMRQRVRRARLEFSNLGQLKRNQALLAMHLADLEEGRGAAVAAHDEVPDPRFPDGIRSRLCTQEQIAQPWFASWIESIGEEPKANRKAWEFAYIAHSLDALGMLAPGRRGVGFGVGQDPLVPLFASRGVEVLASDLDSGSREAAGWQESDQLADSLESMMWPEICDEEQFKRLVSWRPVDMRAIPGDIKGYDFCWSACALEHLGSLPAGLEFIENSLSTLVPGGIAVHTTEYNVESNDDTVETGPCVVYRERDIRGLVERLEDAGHQVAALDLSPGEGVLDHYVDLPPYDAEACLKFLFASYTLTSVALVIRAKA